MKVWEESAGLGRNQEGLGGIRRVGEESEGLSE